MRYFEALATAGHFGRAAELVNVSQPALSVQIAEMEEHLGCKLVERRRGASFLTHDGERLLPEIRDILSRISVLETHARQARGLLEGRVRIGVIPTVAPYLVPLLVPILRRDFPKIEIELKETVTETVVDWLDKGRLDFAIVALPIDHGALQQRRLFADRFLVAGSLNETDVLVSPMAEDSIDAARLLLLEDGHCLRDQALDVCGLASGRQPVDFGATSMATLLQMVSQDMGLTLIPELAAATETQRNTLRVVPFAEPQPHRDIGLIWRRSAGRMQDVDALANAVMECAEKLLPPDATLYREPRSVA
jgi:LysR family hydrogen peroxide-inducible transcriptional activator